MDPPSGAHVDLDIATSSSSHPLTAVPATPGSWVTTRAPSPRPHPWRLRGSTSPWLRAPASSSAFPPFHYGVVKRVRFSIPFQGGEKCETPPRACSSFTVPKNLTPVMPATSCESETERR
ncbi:hypothetical protein GW17_00043422 [Ensete ventricosum]|nr:hypothetical protein GW17_00043422 [Ensete ventricosum]